VIFECGICQRFSYLRCYRIDIARGLRNNVLLLADPAGGPPPRRTAAAAVPKNSKLGSLLCAPTKMLPLSNPGFAFKRGKSQLTKVLQKM